jgi:hypothetical protein
MRKIAALGQLLAFNEQTVFGVNVFSGSVGVRRGFFPGKKGYRPFAKPHEPGKSEDDFKKTKDAWSVYIPVRVRAMVLAGDKLFVGGPPDVMALPCGHQDGIGNGDRIGIPRRHEMDKVICLTYNHFPSSQQCSWRQRKDHARWVHCRRRI